jgi:peptidoglycan hydrolase-like protein with peptidoglycan-binding domain
VGPPPLALASTTTAPPGSEEARRPVCPSYTFRVEYSLRLCDKGPAVRIIQERLVAAGESISIDGYFGPGTEQAVRRFQGAHGLDVDGWVGPDTWRVLVPDAPGVDVDGNGIVDPPELAPS